MKSECKEVEGRRDRPVIDTDKREGKRKESSSRDDGILRQKQAKERGWRDVCKDRRTQEETGGAWGRRAERKQS